MRRDRRTLDEILSQPRWDGLRDRAQAAALEAQQARDIDRLLRVCEDAGVTHVDEIVFRRAILTP